ncbi:MAG: hypothetical protein WA895_08295 [Streptosporangiaceae bacterium]
MTVRLVADIPNWLFWMSPDAVHREGPSPSSHRDAVQLVFDGWASAGVIAAVGR